MIKITGVIRSGTQYMSRCLEAVGINMPHERYGIDGIVSPLHTFDKPDIKWDYVLHQVRNPVNTISTMHTMLDGTWARFKTESITPDFRNLKNLMHFWLYWNEAIEKISDYRYKVEDLEKEWGYLMDKIFKHPCHFPSQINKNVNSRIHGRGGVYLEFRELHECDEEIAMKILEKAVEYGYDPKEITG